VAVANARQSCRGSGYICTIAHSSWTRIKAKWDTIYIYMERERES
jgi:hypothetical protein